MRRIILYTVAALVIFFVIAQLVPYGRNHNNPPVIAEPEWDSMRTRELAVRACYDCHSNETNWAWYSNVAPFSWLVQYDVDAGRGVFNFSEWGRGREESVSGELAEGGMPQWYYVMLHPSSILSASEKHELIDGLRRSGI